MTDGHQTRRVEDSFLGKIVRIWPILLGMSGFLYALITNYNMVRSNTDGIYRLNGVTESLASRVAAMEKDLAVKNAQFAVILSRTERIEDKLDKLISRR